MSARTVGIALGTSLVAFLLCIFFALIPLCAVTVPLLTGILTVTVIVALAVSLVLVVYARRTD